MVKNSQFIGLIFVLITGCQTVNRVPQSVVSSDIDRRWEGRFSNESTLENFSNDLAAELSRRVRTLKRTVRTYHYGTRDADHLDLRRGSSRAEEYTSPVELQPEEAKAYFRDWSSEFQNSVDTSPQVGPGIYAGVDPVQSEHYAGKPFFLMELTVPAGTRYVDLRPEDTLFLSMEFVTKWFQSEDVENFKGYRFGNKFLVSFKSLLRTKPFQEALKRTLAKLKVDALAYDWSKHSFNICNRNSFDQGIAFNFINPEFLRRAPAPKIFIQNLEAGVSGKKRDEYLRLYKIIESAPLSFQGSESSHTIVNNGVSTTQKSVSEPRWYEGTYRMRILSHPWSVSLGQPNKIRMLIKDPAEAEKLFKNTMALPTNTSGGASVELDQSYFLTRTRVESGYKNTTLTHDPLVYLKKDLPSEYKERVNQIKSQTFGCSEKYPEENETPPLN